MTYALWCFLLAYLLTLPVTSWVLYLAAMHLIRQKDGAPKVAATLAKVLWVPFLVQDWILNATWGSVLFMDLPRELTLTARLKRYHKDHPGTWRDVRARWICDGLLNHYDPKGKHC